MDWRGYVILAIGIGVPLALLLHRREDELFAWLCISVGISLFDARVGINFAAARLVGLLVLPFLPLGAFDFQRLLATRPMRILLASLGYLALLGFVYGFLYPWPNEGYLRPFAQTAPGRVLIYSVRLLADLGIALLVARRVMRGTRPDAVLKLILIGTSIAVVGGLAEFVTRIQFYQILTGYPINEIPGRVRGLNFEPRGLGLTMVQGGFIALLWARHRQSRFAMALAIAHFVVLMLAVSASALVAAAFGWLCLLIFERRARAPLLGFGVVTASVLALMLLVGRDLPLVASWVTNLSQRFTLRQALDVATQTPVEILAQFLDIFDYTAFMALMTHPLGVLIGFGPGLVMLPGSQFIPNDPKWAWVVNSNEGITSPPSMGILLEWSNGGIPMLLLWLALVITCSRALSRMAAADPEHADSWRLGRGALVAIAATYVVQASPISAIWPLFIGLGLGAAALEREAARVWTRAPVVAAEGLA
jgi:hypothetical protein